MLVMVADRYEKLLARQEYRAFFAHKTTDICLQFGKLRAHPSLAAVTGALLYPSLG